MVSQRSFVLVVPGQRSFLWSGGVVETKTGIFIKTSALKLHESATLFQLHTLQTSTKNLFGSILRLLVVLLHLNLIKFSKLFVKQTHQIQRHAGYPERFGSRTGAETTPPHTPMEDVHLELRLKSGPLNHMLDLPLPFFQNHCVIP